MNVHIATATITKYLAYGSATITKIYGYNNSGGDVYLQIHENPTVAASDVPKIAGLHCPVNTWFDWFWDGGLGVSEFLIANSSVQASYTAAPAGVDMTVEYQTSFPACNEAGTALVTIVGDLTTGVAERQVWSEASGLSAPKLLLRADVKNNTGADVYPFVSSRDTNLLTARDMTNLKLIANGATSKFAFGRGLRKENLSVAGTSYTKGCTVVASAAGSLNGGTLISATDLNIRAIYATTV